MAIDRFRGENYFLSNMFPFNPGIEVEAGVTVPTVEHAYQAAKFRNPDAREQVLQADTGVKSKELAVKFK